MSGSRLSSRAAKQELERIIMRMQNIQRTIKASRQPASAFELEELKSLGREYARIVDCLADSSNDSTST